MKDDFSDIVITLSGVVQGLALAKNFAETGKMDDVAFEASINSLFQTKPLNTLAVFGSIAHLTPGFEKLCALSGPTASIFDLIRYLHPILYLERKISHSKKIHDALSKRVETAKKQVAFFSLTHPSVMANLSDSYLDAIKDFRIKFLIPGDQRVLTNRANTDKIRSLLLAAIRAAICWRQVSGSLLQLLIFRAKIHKKAQHYLRQVKNL